MLHNMMLSEMVCEASPSQLQRGCHLVSIDSMWLEGPSQPCAPVQVDAYLKRLKLEFDCCRTLLSSFLESLEGKNPNNTSIDWRI
jgi:hypothetical protein